MGTRFMATVEAPIHENIKQALVEGTISDTTLVMRSVRNTERVYKNKVTDEVQRIEAESPGQFDKIHHLVKGENYRVSFQETGDTQNSVWSCGPVIALIDDIPTCEDLINKIVADAEKIITDLPRRVHD
jgi:nitronate monooxygenase